LTILKTYARLYGDSLDKALPLLAEVTGATLDLRLSLGEVEMAVIGDFLVFAGSPQAVAPLQAVTATVVVNDINDVGAVLAAYGAQVIAGPADGPTGRWFYARHADGAQVEYIQLTPELASALAQSAAAPALIEHEQRVRVSGDSTVVRPR
jgi:predicted enzyme related to lactoylglutathione lyase